MGSTAGGAAVLVARAFQEASAADLTADYVEVFSSGGRLTAIVNCTGHVQDSVWQGFATWFHHSVTIPSPEGNGF